MPLDATTKSMHVDQEVVLKTQSLGKIDAKGADGEVKKNKGKRGVLTRRKNMERYVSASIVETKTILGKPS
jgi:hypothetical protein